MAACFGGKTVLTFLTVLLMSVTVCQTGWAKEIGDLVDLIPVSTMNVEAVVGRTATLPCSLEPDTKEDRVYMVLWYRHTGGKPFYSFDVRGRSFNKALHWSDPLAFGKRAEFHSIVRPSSLTIGGVQLDDEGIYRCRVDFKNTPTRNFQIRLNVIVPPHQMLLSDEAGRDVAGVIGPLEVGENFTLLCEIRGGRPKPTLTWLINNETVEDHVILKNNNKTTISRIKVTSVDRSWLNKTVRCRATNSQLLNPHERTARVEMNLRPTSVTITNKPGQMSAESDVTLVCVASGSRPPAQITWYRENRKYTRGTTESITDNSTHSRLTLSPQPEDDGTTMRCRAENPVLRTAIEDSFKMTVIYRPVLTMSLGSTLNPNDIKEGDDVYFECNIKANPREHKITWYHNENQVTQNMSSGVFISTKSLVLQRVTKKDTGLYSCRAANQMGESSSQPAYLRVQYAPVCSHSTALLIGARLDEELRVRCSVTADPADVSFYWQFNNSGESFQVSPARYVSIGSTTSELKYRAASERDYGALLCRASNNVGEQRRPCVFQIVPAARPSPPRNCSSSRVMEGSIAMLSVRCLVGYDGGLAQHLTLEAIGENVRILVNATPEYQDLTAWLNVSWSSLETLSDDETLAVVARNSKGASEPVILSNIVFRDAAKRTEETSSRVVAKFPVAAAFAALAAVTTATCAGVILAIRRRRSSGSSSKRPCEVVVDSRGRRCVLQQGDKTEPKPDILNPKPETSPPRVVLESSDNKTFTVKEITRRHDLEHDLPLVGEHAVPPR